MKVHPPLELSPSRVFASSTPAGWCRRFDSQRFRVPSTTSLGLAPCEPGCPDPARLRSQAFATSQRFPSTPELCGLVSCRCRPWDPSLQSFPPGEDRLPLSGLHAPLQSSTGVQRRVARGRSPPGFSDSRARTQLPGSPEGYGLPFCRPVACVPVVLGIARRTRLVPPASPASKLYSPRRVVPGIIEFPRRHRSLLSWASCPFGAFSSRTSDPRPARPRRVRACILVRGQDARSGGPQPSRPGEPSRASMSLEEARRRLPASFEAGPHRLSAAAPSLMVSGSRTGARRP